MVHGALRVDPRRGNSRGIPKDGDEVRTLTESVIGSNQNLCLNFDPSTSTN